MSPTHIYLYTHFTGENTEELANGTSLVAKNSDCKESTCNAGDPGSIPGLGRSPGEGNGNPLQYSYLEIPWTEWPGRLQPMGLQKGQTGLSD